MVLDLGRVESLAKVEVNGKDFGDVWSPPYRIPLTGAVKAGKNTLKVSVTDTWYNRLVFDAGTRGTTASCSTPGSPRRSAARGRLPVRRRAAPCATPASSAPSKLLLCALSEN